MVALRFVAQNWTQYFISQVLALSPAPLNTFACLFISFLRTSAQEIAYYYSLCPTVGLIIFIIWLHPFSLQKPPCQQNPFEF